MGYFYTKEFCKKCFHSRLKDGEIKKEMKTEENNKTKNLEDMKIKETEKEEEKIKEMELKERRNVEHNIDQVSNMLRESPKPPHAKSECVSTISTQVFFNVF